MLREFVSVFFNLAKVGSLMALIYFPLVVAVHFPMTVGPAAVNPIDEAEQARDFYEVAYQSREDQESEYVLTSLAAAHDTGVVKMLEKFIDDYDLHDKRHLEVGAGSGSLQDLVDDYTGLDIAASAERYFHKPFVQGSATELPFDDNEFDSIWTVWTLEHVPNPELALDEMRRVVKPGGKLFVFPAWNSTTWAPKGYRVRPYSDFGLWDKGVKASLSVRENPLFRVTWLFPTRLLRRAWWNVTQSPTRLRYTSYEPNYTNFWEPDSDALASIDNHEAMLWFLSRGDDCMNCPGDWLKAISLPFAPLNIQVNK